MVLYKILFIHRSGNKSEGDTSLLGSHDPPVNKATGHPQWQNVNKQKINGITKPGHWQWYAVAFMLQISPKFNYLCNCMSVSFVPDTQ